MSQKQLTPREWEIVKVALRGMSTKEMSTELEIKERTVTVHLQNIFQKLGIHSRCELIVMFSRTNLLIHEGVL
jgi:DNA-binding NarL/FixJ family response regulator